MPTAAARRAPGTGEERLAMQTQVGAVIEGKVTGITKFGAFVALEDGKSGLIHISEIADTYVSNIADFLAVGQTVKVRVVSIGEGGKINLSLKKAAENAHPAAKTPHARFASPAGEVAPASGDKAFEDKLKKFMQESDSRISDNRIYSDRRERRRRK